MTSTATQAAPVPPAAPRGEAGRRRIQFLDGVRGWAVAMVVLHHVVADVQPSYAAWSAAYLDLGRVGVVAFFLVSGYVIPLSLARQDLREFALRRAARLLPAYWVAMACLALLDVGAFSGQPPQVLVLNLLMLNGLVGVASILPAAWTLSIELLFYLQSAVASRLRRLETAVHAAWAWLGLYLVLCGIEGATGKDLPATLPLLMAVAGVGQALSRRDGTGSRTWVPLSACVVVLVPLGALLSGDTGEWRPLTSVTSFVAGLLVFATCYLARSRRVPAALLWLGGVSYSLYLFHGPVHGAVERVGLDGPALAVVSVLVGLVVARLVHRLVEQPSQELGRRLTRRRAVPTPRVRPH